MRRHAVVLVRILQSGMLCIALTGCGERSAGQQPEEPAAARHVPSLPPLSIRPDTRAESVSPSNAFDDPRVPPTPAAAYPTTVLPRDAVVAAQFVIALDRKTGSVRWKSPRRGMHSYSTPVLIQADGRRQIVSVGGGGVVGYETDTGRELWWLRHSGHSVVPSPVFSHGMVFLCTGYYNPQLWAVDLTGIDETGGSRELNESQIVWESTRGTPLIASPLIVGDEIYLVTDAGVATCCDVRSGTIHWQHRLHGRFFASPWLADGRVHFLSEDGVCTIIQPGQEYVQLAVNRLDGLTLATPAAAGRSLFVRTDRHLYCIEEGTAAPPQANADPADSPQFRGPGGQGHPRAFGQPLLWSEAHNIAWKVAVPGQSWSSPVVAGDQVWLATALDEGKSLRGICFYRKTGQLIHDVELFQKTDPGHVHLRNTHASATPVIDAGCVYFHFGAHGTAAVSVDGKVLWRTQIPYHHHHGPASSPLVVDDLLIMNCDGAVQPYDFDLIQKMGPDYTGDPAGETVLPGSTEANE